MEKWTRYVEYLAVAKRTKYALAEEILMKIKKTNKKEVVNEILDDINLLSKDIDSFVLNPENEEEKIHIDKILTEVKEPIPLDKIKLNLAQKYFQQMTKF